MLLLLLCLCQGNLQETCVSKNFENAFKFEFLRAAVETFLIEMRKIREAYPEGLT